MVRQSDTFQDSDQSTAFVPQVKICGLTQPDEAVACAELGAAAIGFVFYPPSPRFVSDEQAERIARQLPAHVSTVGVFVDEPFVQIMRKVARCGLNAVQLHGGEPPELGERLLLEGLIVLRGLYVNKRPRLEEADSYPASAYLVEWAGGPLPGGNAQTWEWGSIAPFCRGKPVVMAGGLSPDNIAQAIAQASPDAVDVSSGVEARPGRKDVGRVQAFLHAVVSSSPFRKPRKIFRNAQGNCMKFCLTE